MKERGGKQRKVRLHLDPWTEGEVRKLAAIHGESPTQTIRRLLIAQHRDERKQTKAARFN